MKLDETQLRREVYRIIQQAQSKEEAYGLLRAAEIISSGIAINDKSPFEPEVKPVKSKRMLIWAD